MDFALLLLLSGLLLAVAAHVFALAMSRRARSLSANVAFWSGVAGLLSVPVTIALIAAAIPYIVTGPPGELELATTVALSVLAVLPVISFVSGLRVRRNGSRPN